MSGNLTDLVFLLSSLICSLFGSYLYPILVCKWRYLSQKPLFFDLFGCLNVHMVFGFQDIVIMGK